MLCEKCTFFQFFDQIGGLAGVLLFKFQNLTFWVDSINGTRFDNEIALMYNKENAFVCFLIFFSFQFFKLTFDRFLSKFFVHQLVCNLSQIIIIACYLCSTVQQLIYIYSTQIQVSTHQIFSSLIMTNKSFSSSSSNTCCDFQVHSLFSNVNQVQFHE